MLGMALPEFERGVVFVFTPSLSSCMLKRGGMKIILVGKEREGLCMYVCVATTYLGDASYEILCPVFYRQGLIAKRKERVVDIIARGNPLASSMSRCNQAG
tara:strand:- start:121 stop:423 length:303 start_codon:yes stop_codon:yes gene_type:complete